MALGVRVSGGARGLPSPGSESQGPLFAVIGLAALASASERSTMTLGVRGLRRRPGSAFSGIREPGPATRGGRARRDSERERAFNNDAGCPGLRRRPGSAFSGIREPGPAIRGGRARRARILKPR